MAAVVDVSQQQILIKAKIYFYGTLANTGLVEKILQEINEFWNQPELLINHLNQEKKVKVNVKGNYISEKRAKRLLRTNKSKEINFVRIEHKNIAERSMMGYGLGENSGHWIITDQLGESTTAAHEFGHALGLPHPEQLDYRGTGIPPIMAPRGTLVDKAFQWNPLVDAGMPGGTMRPIFRRVSVEELKAVLIDLPGTETKSFEIGFLSNTLYDFVGNKIPLH